MSTLTVVRHGQARPFDPNPDQLSELGELQARALAEYWKRLGVAFDEVWSGTLYRQRQTAALAVGTEVVASEDWNEYDANGILHNFAPPYELEDAADRNRKFQKIFEPAMLAWLAAEEHATVETWGAFRSRVLRGLRRLQDGGSNRSVVLFTSGGPISVLVQAAIGAAERSFLEVNWRVRNCSISEFTFSKDRLSLDSFNSLPHVETAELRTFR
ncbi:MAG TPA: histidine phosphatase family protein [Bryobacteraceae bacterium]|jgi:broad specificity phosphatase PhoE|nr:histidine phosphatase family protein [Bryobacteraceae bacterium]